jgi:hypothetical protein
MRRQAAVAAVLASLAAAGIAGVAGADPRSASSSRPPARLMVAGREYNLQLSRGAVRRGPAVIQFLNRGEDPHDLRLRRFGVQRTISVPALRAGELVQFETRLQRGRYHLWCSLPGHKDRGMRAVLKVRSR